MSLRWPTLLTVAIVAMACVVESMRTRPAPAGIPPLTRLTSNRMFPWLTLQFGGVIAASGIDLS